MVESLNGADLRRCQQGRKQTIMISRRQLLEHAKAQKATDIHVCAGAPIMFRIGGKLVPITKEKLTVTQSREISLELLTDEQKAQFEKDLDYDLMLADGDGRYRINIGYFNGEVGSTIRILPTRPMTIDELLLPEVVTKLAQRTKGLVLITGSTSQGKTTTMTAMIDHINTTCEKHIVTIEDPIEYVHTNKVGVVRQREIGRDTQSFHTGLRAALRQDPDVIAIGEMRDYETIKIALTAAETGVLVLSTLHVISIDKIIERLLSYAPASDEGQLRFLLAESLQGMIHQELVPTVDGGQRVACEVLVVTSAAKNIIRRKGGFFLRSVIETGRKHGMMTMLESLNGLLEAGTISEDVAKAVSINYE
ncbi:MAG: PilT/PilU family type 4a pilus ATPase [Phycisphaerales bacterium]|nr:MAG: PilT/PilU family type 4a pilus ATPase [Phycisphaerales bacterium]